MYSTVNPSDLDVREGALCSGPLEWRGMAEETAHALWTSEEVPLSHRAARKGRGGFWCRLVQAALCLAAEEGPTYLAAE